MKIEFKKELLCVGIIIVMFLIVIFNYNYLPEKIPIHWNIKGEIDGYLPKNPLSAFIMPLMALFFWILFLILPYFDPRKEKYEKFAGVYQLIKNTTIIFLLFLQIIIVVNSRGNLLPVEKLVPAGISLLFIILGNVMGKIRHNYFVGIKLPWTIENEVVWNKTHRFSGRVWVVCGIIGLISISFNSTITSIIFFCCIGVMLLIPIIYSYSIYRKIVVNK